MKLSSSFAFQRTLLYIVSVVVLIGDAFSIPVFLQSGELLVMRALGKTAVACGCAIVPALSNPIIFVSAFLTSATFIFFALRIIISIIRTILHTRRTINSWTILSHRILSFEGKTYSLNVIRSVDSLVCSAGTFFPELYISTSAMRRLTADELLAATLHEIGHIRAHHPLHTQLATALARVFFLSQYSTFAQYQSFAHEHAADTYALRFIKRTQLLSAITHFFSPVETDAALSLFSLEESRIKLLLGYAAPTAPSMFSSVLILVLVIAGVSFFPLTLFARSDTLAAANAWQGQNNTTCAYVAPPPEEYICVQDVGQTLLIYPINK